jgi:rfaG protein
MKKIWIVAPFTEIYNFDARDRFQYIANELSKNKDYEVHLFTSDFIHLKKEFINNSVEDKYSYNVHLIHENGYKKNISLSRAISHVSFAFNLMKKVKNMEKPDLIYCAYPMMTSAYLIGKFAKKNTIPFIIDVQDTWPESISAGINIDNFFVKTLMFPFTVYANKIYKLADLVFGVSQTYVNRANVKGTRSKEFIPVYIGAEGNKFCNISKLKEKKEDEIWCVYIGTLSYSYDLMTLILAFSDLEKINSNIKLYILGDGPEFNSLKNKAEELGLLNKTVYLKGLLPYEEMVKYLKTSDIALNAIKRKSLGTITNKFGDFVSAGLPILNCCQMEEVKNIILEKELGINYIPENSSSLKDAILFLLENKDKMIDFSKNSKKFADEKFDRKESYKIIFQKIKEILL